MHSELPWEALIQMEQGSGLVASSIFLYHCTVSAPYCLGHVHHCSPMFPSQPWQWWMRMDKTQQTTECSAHHFSDHELGLTCAIWGSFAPRNLATRLSFNRLNLQEAGASQLALWPWSSSTHKANTQMITSHDAPNKKSSTTLPQFI